MTEERLHRMTGAVDGGMTSGPNASLSLLLVLYVAGAAVACASVLRGVRGAVGRAVGFHDKETFAFSFIPPRQYRYMLSFPGWDFLKYSYEHFCVRGLACTSYSDVSYADCRDRA